LRVPTDGAFTWCNGFTFSSGLNRSDGSYLIAIGLMGEPDCVGHRQGRRAKKGEAQLAWLPSDSRK